MARTLHWGLPLLGLALFFGLVSVLVNAEEEPTNGGLDQKVANFTLADLAGKEWSLHAQKDQKAIVLVFLSCECPMSNNYLPVLAELAKTYEPKGATLVAINANASESAKQIAEHVKEFRIPFPVLRDEKHAAVATLKAATNPEAFVLDGEFKLRYRGRIDDGYSARLKKNPRVTRHDLKEAIEEVLAGKEVGTPVTKAYGCPIVLEKTASAEPAKGAVTYHRDVLPILQNQCQGCHRPGEVGPFALMTYPQAKKWGEDIKAYTANRQMPPWKPVGSDGLFRDERHLTHQEIATLAKWVDSGMSEGDPKDAPPPRKFVEGWQLGEPDLVLTVPEEMELAATGRDLFRVFVLPTNLKEDKFVSAIEVKPGNSRVVHHTLNFIDTSGKGRELEEKERKREKSPDEPDKGPGYTVAMGVGFSPRGGLGGWAPGQVPRHLPDGVGYFLPKDSDLAIQVHYHRTGRPERDKTRIGLYFAKKPVTQRFRTVILPGLFFQIPAGEERFKVEGQLWANQEFNLHTVMPHMHLLGKDIKCTMTLPDGTTKTLVDVQDWDYNWQETYYLKEPMKIPAGTKFHVVAHYDNSDKNPLNPNNPPKPVRIGEQTTNEMCFVFLGATSDQGRVRTSLFPPQKPEEKKENK